jgi:hypothetical protein
MLSLYIFNLQRLYNHKIGEKTMNYINDAIFLLNWLPIDGTIVAQTIRDPDVLGQIQRAFTHFVQTGQAWALLIGVAIGYMIRNLTSYG